MNRQVAKSFTGLTLSGTFAWVAVPSTKEDARRRARAEYHFGRRSYPAQAERDEAIVWLLSRSSPPGLRSRGWLSPRK